MMISTASVVVLRIPRASHPNAAVRHGLLLPLDLAFHKTFALMSSAKPRKKRESQRALRYRYIPMLRVCVFFNSSIRDRSLCHLTLSTRTILMYCTLRYDVGRLPRSQPQKVETLLVDRDFICCYDKCVSVSRNI